jgi:precorrin-2/cobalt-factor-2 C20-methyltransferase
VSAGTAYGLGVGPGDPELITVKALALLRRCPVIAYPAPETGDSLARRIVSPHLEDRAPIEYAIRMPIEAARFPAEAVYDRAARELGAHLEAGRDVAVLCQGDPFFYGSFMYLFARLARRFTVVVVPGVSSLTACAASMGIRIGRGRRRRDHQARPPSPQAAARARGARARRLGALYRARDLAGAGDPTIG